LASIAPPSLSEFIFAPGRGLLSIIYGVTTDLYGLEVNPGNMNQWLIEHYGYKSNGNLIWKKIRTYSNNKVSFNNFGGDVEQELRAQRPAILFVPESNPHHFIVATGKVRGTNQDTFSINDPYWAERTTLDDVNYNNRYNEVVKLKPGADLRRGLAIYGSTSPSRHTSRSPNDDPKAKLELLLIDPLNRRVGFDFETQTRIEEIPDATYRCFYWRLFPTEGWAGGSKEINVMDMIDGIYKLKVLGKETGTYSISFYFDNYPEVDESRDIEIQGTNKPGAITKIYF